MLGVTDVLMIIALLPSAVLVYWYFVRPRIPRKTLNKIVSLETENIAREREKPTAYYNRGLAYLQLGEYKKSVSDLTEALRFNPDNVDAYTSRGNTYTQLNLYDEAIQDYSTAIRIDPQDWLTYFNRARVYYHFKSEHDLALSDALKAIELAPNDSGGYLIAGYVLHRQEKLDDALTHLEKYAELEGKNAVPGVLDMIMYTRAKLRK